MALICLHTIIEVALSGFFVVVVVVVAFMPPFRSEASVSFRFPAAVFIHIRV